MTYPYRARTAKVLVGMLVAACLIVSCSAEKEPSMQQQTQAEATQRVRGYAQTVAAVVGVQAADHETGVAASPCRGANGETAEDGRFYVQGNYQLPLAGGHERVLTQLRDTWQQQGWTVKDFRMFNAAEGTVSAENPSDGVQISAESSRPATAIALLILTPCYEPAR